MRLTRQTVIRTATALTAALHLHVAIAAVPQARPADQPLDVEERQPAPETALEQPHAPAAVQPQAGGDEPRVTLREIRIEGNRLIPTDELLQTVQTYIGKPVSSADLEAIRLRLTRHYIDQGYINSGALLPDQAVNRGIVTYLIVEGTLNDVTLGKSELLRESYLRKRILKGNRRALNIETLRNNLTALRNNPNIRNLHAELVPGKTFGTSSLLVDIVDNTRHAATVSLDNYSPPSIGEKHISVAYRNGSLFKGSERLDLVLQATEGLREASVNFALPVNADDVEFFIGVNRSEADVVEEPFDRLNIFSETRAVSIGLQWPLLRSLNDADSFSISLDRRESKTALFDEPFSFSQGFVDGRATVAALRIANHWRRSQPGYTLAMRTLLSRGLDALDSSINENIPDSDYTSLVNQFIFLRRFDNPRYELLLRNDIQWASEPLLSMEQFSSGGVNSVRGYRENRIVSDRGLFASAELRYRATPALGLSVFTDYANADNQDRPLNGEDTLYSAGLGLSWRIGSYSRLELEWAEALSGDNNNDDSLQARGVHLSFSSTVDF
ncbi:MAG TPA: ShlB/FhaC/HecB family hemolysin secretion/activation protein [Gammaproteobacteria bacterium]